MVAFSYFIPLSYTLPPFLMKFSFLLLLMILLSFVGFTTHGQPSKKSTYKKAILEGRRLIDSLQQKQKIPGIDLALSINGEIVWAEGFGFADLEQKIQVRAGKTRFR